jgi:hypothetical protein
MNKAKKAFEAAHVDRNLKKDIFDEKMAAYKRAIKAREAARKDKEEKAKAEQAAGRARDHAL